MSSKATKPVNSKITRMINNFEKYKTVFNMSQSTGSIQPVQSVQSIQPAQQSVPSTNTINPMRSIYNQATLKEPFNGNLLNNNIIVLVIFFIVICICLFILLK